MREKLYSYGISKTFNEGDVILDEHANIRSIPIVTIGSIRVMRTDEEGREILLYYIKSGESCIMSFLGGMHHETSKVKAIAEKQTDERLLGPIRLKSKNADSKTINVTHEQLANDLGTARVVVFRLLKQLEVENLVILGRNKITVV